MQTQAAVKLDVASTSNDAVTPLSTLQNRGEFIDRHIGPDAEQIEAMHAILGDNARPIQTEQMAMLTSPIDQNLSAAMSDHAAHAPAAGKDETAHTQMAVASQGH